jgi:hypothetical protein
MFSIPAMAEVLAEELEPELVGWCYEMALALAGTAAITTEAAAAMHNEAVAREMGERMRALADALFPFATIADLLDMDRAKGSKTSRHLDDRTLFSLEGMDGTDLGGVTVEDMRRARAARRLLLDPEHASEATRALALGRGKQR